MYLRDLREAAPDGPSLGINQSVRAGGAWQNDDSIDVDEIAGWLLMHEDKGWREKS